MPSSSMAAHRGHKPRRSQPLGKGISRARSDRPIRRRQRQNQPSTNADERSDLQQQRNPHLWVGAAAGSSGMRLSRATSKCGIADSKPQLIDFRYWKQSTLPVLHST